MSENRISEDHSIPQSRHALGAPMASLALSSHHPAGAAFSQIPLVHPSLFPMMPHGLSLGGSPFATAHQNKNAHGINDMGPPMFSVPLNLGIPGQPGTAASYESFNPDALLQPPASKSSAKTIPKASSAPAISNNYTMPVASIARPESPNKKNFINMVSPSSTLNSQIKAKSSSLPLPNSHMLLPASGANVGGNTKSAFSVVMPSTSSNAPVKILAEDGDLVVGRNKVMKDSAGGTIDVLHAVNNSNNQIKPVTNSELGSTANNLHWKQPALVPSTLQNNTSNSSISSNSSSKALGSHAAGSHPSVGQLGGVLDPAALRHKPLHTPLSGATPPASSVDMNRVPTSTWSSASHLQNDKAPHPPPTVVTSITQALSTNSTPSVTSSTTTLVKPTPQWPSRDHAMREPGTPGDAADHPRSQPLPPSTVSQSPTSNRPSILRKRSVDSSSVKREAQNFSKTTPGQQNVASPTNGFVDYHGNQSPASLPNENAAIAASRLEENVPDFMSPRKKPRKQLVNPTEDHYASNVPSSNMGVETPTRSHGRDESTPTSLPSNSSESQTVSQDKSPPESLQLSTPLHRSPYSVCSNYKLYTKAAHSHFWRYTDVRVKEDSSRQQALSFLSSKTISKQATGWKLSRVQTHLDDVDKLEKKILETTEKLKQRLGSCSSEVLPCSKEELDVFSELVQGNIDRSNRAMSETAVVKENMGKVLMHKSKAMDLVQRYIAYRQQNMAKHPKRRKTH